jgi:hypothetical protein
MSPRQTHALNLVKRFREHPPGRKVWYHVERGPLADGMEERIKDPNSVYQGHYGTCGPSGIVRDIIMDDPEEYVKLTTSLYWTGRCKIHHGPHAWPQPLCAGYDLRRYKPEHSINPADWILTATMRDRLNDTFCREKFSVHQAVDKTIFVKEKSLFRGMGYRVIFAHGTFDHPAPPHILEEANSYQKRHFHVQIGIDSTLIRHGQQDTPPDSDKNHWVELLTPITIEREFSSDATVSFTVFSPWKEKRFKLPLDQTKPLRPSVFRSKFFGYVAAKY